MLEFNPWIPTGQVFQQGYQARQVLTFVYFLVLPVPRHQASTMEGLPILESATVQRNRKITGYRLRLT